MSKPPTMKASIDSLSRRSALQCIGMGAIAPLLPASFAIAQSPSAAAFSPAESSVDLPDSIVPDGLFVNPRGDNTEQVVRLVKSLGLDSIRMGFIWVSFEKTKGAPFDFTKHDRLMAEFHQAGIKRFIGLIGSQNEAYHCVWRQKDHDLREGALAAFAKFAGAVAERYRDYDILWEIINEPNENNDMSVVSNYVRVCEVLYRLAHRLAADNPDDYVAVFEKDGKRILAAWTSAAPHPLKLAVSSGKATVTDLLGSRRESPATEGYITLNLTGGIQYVEL